MKARATFLNWPWFILTLTHLLLQHNIFLLPLMWAILTFPALLRIYCLMHVHLLPEVLQPNACSLFLFFFHLYLLFTVFYRIHKEKRRKSRKQHRRDAQFNQFFYSTNFLNNYSAAHLMLFLFFFWWLKGIKGHFVRKKGIFLCLVKVRKLMPLMFPCGATVSQPRTKTENEAKLHRAQKVFQEAS